jgi:hypothetical protein
MKLFEEKNENIFRLNSKRLDSISADFPSHVFLVLSRSESNLRFEDLKAAVWEKGIILEFSMAGLIIRTQKNYFKSEALQKFKFYFESFSLYPTKKNCIGCNCWMYCVPVSKTNLNFFFKRSFYFKLTVICFLGVQT